MIIFVVRQQVCNRSEDWRMQKKPKCILLFSGKRKSGKDYFTDRLFRSCETMDVIVVKISAPIKNHFARSLNLDFEALMGSGEYKENYRKDMISWSDGERARDPGIFCRAALEMFCARSKSIWIVSDVRRITDVQWFKDNFGSVVKTIRIEASDKVRSSRGWCFVPGVDDVPSECGLDEYTDWDWVFKNDGDVQSLDASVKIISEFIQGST